MAAVVRVEPYQTRLPHPLATAIEDVDVGAAEAVDGLLRVADGRQVTGALAREELDQGELRLVGVLELVDHDELKAPRVVPTHDRAVPHGRVGLFDQVVVVEHALVELPGGIGRLHPARELEEGRRAVGRGGEGDLGACKRVGLLRGSELLGDGLALRRHRDGGEGFQGGRSVLLARCERVEGAQRLQGGPDLARGGSGEFLGAELLHAHEQVAHQVREVAVARARGSAGERIEAPGQGGGRIKDVLHELHGAAVAGGRGVVAAPELVDGRPQIRVPPRLGHDLVHGREEQAFLSGAGHNAELGVEPQVEGVAMQDARAHAVDGRDPRVVDRERSLGHAAAPEVRPDALADLAGGRLGERDNENLSQVVEEGPAVGGRAGRKRPRDALGQRERLARAGAGLHEQGLVERLGDLPLVVIERGEVHLRRHGAAALVLTIGHLESLLSQLSTGQ